MKYVHCFFLGSYWTVWTSTCFNVHFFSSPRINFAITMSPFLNRPFPIFPSLDGAMVLHCGDPVVLCRGGVPAVRHLDAADGCRQWLGVRLGTQSDKLRGLSEPNQIWGRKMLRDMSEPL